jgi:hypothetical protein
VRYVRKRIKDKADIQTTSEESTKNVKMSLSELEKRLGIILEDWQRQVVIENQKDIIMLCSRKSGKTTAMAFKIVLNAINYPNQFTMILSAGQRQSSEVFQTVTQFLYIIEAQFRNAPTATGCTLENGHRILSLPTGYTGATIRTYSAHRIYMDEAAFIADEVYKAVSPCLLKFGIQKIIASTPKGSRGFFYEEWQRGEGFLRFYIPWTKIRHIQQDKIKDIIEKERAINGDKYIQQEYEALFVEQGAGLIPESLITATFKNKYEDGNTSQGKTYLGVTSAVLGKNYHYIVFCQSQANRHRIYRLEIISDSDKSGLLSKRLAEIKAQQTISKVITSESSIGVGYLNDIVGIFGKKSVISFDALAHEKENVSVGRRQKIIEKDLYDHLVNLMQKGQIHIDDDPIIEDALRSLDYDFLPNKENKIIIFGRAKAIAEAVVYSLIPTMFTSGRPIEVYGSGETPEKFELNSESWKSLFTM